MLPVLLSIPHGGRDIPTELRDRVSITPHDLFDDGDAFTLDIYDLGDEVARVVRTDVARAFVDVNRAPDARPPEFPDGVVKSATCLQRPIYQAGLEPGNDLTELLIARYHAPYHARLEQATSDAGIRLALDCHSMLPTPPPIETHGGEPRPLFCLSNGEGATAPSALLEELAAAIASTFEIEPTDVRQNDPFQGGYIIRRHGRRRTPWIQVEMNRNQYLAEPWFDRESLLVDAERLTELRRRFSETLHRIEPSLD
jgi:formiminoglutamase